MNSYSVCQRYDPQYAIIKFLQSSPKPNAVIRLNLHTDRIFNNKYTPFLFQIGTFPQNLALEIRCISVFVHLSLNDLDLCFDQMFRYQRREVGHDLFDLGAAAGEAGY